MLCFWTGVSFLMLMGFIVSLVFSLLNIYIFHENSLGCNNVLISVVKHNMSTSFEGELQNPVFLILIIFFAILCYPYSIFFCLQHSYFRLFGYNVNAPVCVD